MTSFAQNKGGTGSQTQGSDSKVYTLSSVRCCFPEQQSGNGTTIWIRQRSLDLGKEKKKHTLHHEIYSLMSVKDISSLSKGGKKQKDISLEDITYQVWWLVINSSWNRGLRLMSEWEKERKKCRGKAKEIEGQGEKNVLRKQKTFCVLFLLKY